MRLLTDEELEQTPECGSFDEGLRAPEKVLRFRAYKQENAIELMKVLEFRNLQSLSISLSDVSTLLPHLSKLGDLQDLHLQACDVSLIPESFLQLRNLRSLGIGNSDLQEFVPEIGQLKNLERLYLTQNALKRLPYCIGDLSHLKVLSLSYNRIEELPDSVCHLKELESLFLDVNRLNYLPEALGNLQKLQVLTLKSNQLRNLPDSICGLPHLKTLSLEHNPFESLPRQLGTQSGLQLTIEADKRFLFMDWTYRHSANPIQIALADMDLFVSPTSELRSPLIAAIRESGLGEDVSLIASHARESVVIYTTEADDYSTVGSSRLGGFPDLESSSQFPTTDGLYWIFLGQINLEELAPLNSYLPRSGLLSFFLNSTESLEGKVLFQQSTASKLKTVRHAGVEEMLSPEDDYTGRPHRLRFERHFALPHLPPAELSNDKSWVSYYNSETLHPSMDHQINGYTYTQHESPQHLAANALRGQPSEWVPLLQLGWDSNVGFCFWDAGTVTFCIHQEDLRRHDFSNVHVSLESS